MDMNINQLDDDEGTVLSQENFHDNNFVKMMPQDAGEARSEADLGFMTEVDAEFIAVKKGKESQNTGEGHSTKYSEVDGTTSMPMNNSMLEIEKAEFKLVIKELIGKETTDQLQLEERILGRLRKQNLSKGWNRPTGRKVAPLKILQSLV